MMTWVRTLERNNLVASSLLVVVLAALLVFSPAEATLGSVVKIVYLHGAAERISTYVYLAATLLGVAQLALSRPQWARWTRAALETAILFWLAAFLISLPAQVLAWGGFVWDEPRVIGAAWIVGLTALVYGIARWLDDPTWMALAACADALIVLIVLRGEVNFLHPLSPIIASDSVAIKLFYAAIVLVTGALALLLTRYRAQAGMIKSTLAREA